MENSTRLAWRTLIAGLAIGLLALIIWAGLSANFLSSFAQVMANPWGLVAIADLYFGFVIFSVILLVVDGAKLSSFIWIVALFCVGNVLSAVWLVLRLPKLLAAFRN